MSIKWEFYVDKPIFLVLPGHSVDELKRRWDEFKDYDCMWAGINNCVFLGQFIPMPIDIVIHYCQHVGCNVCQHKYCLKASEARGNSLFEFLLQCGENSVKDLVLFGADGYSDKDTPFYYNGGVHQQMNAHKAECEVFNRANLSICTKVLNVSPNSHYTKFDKISYDEFLKLDYYAKK